MTHDRYMLDRVSTVVLGLDGLGGAERFADYSQWEDWQTAQLRKVAAASKNQANAPRNLNAKAADSTPETPKKKLSYNDARELRAMEQAIAAAEQGLRDKKAALENPEITADRLLLEEACREAESAQKEVDRLYARWAVLEGK